MLIKDKDGVVRQARIAPGFMTIVADYDGEERVFEFPGATLKTWEMEIVGASDEERAAMLEHNIMPEQHTLWVEDENGERHAAHIDFAPTLMWGRFGCASARAIEEGDEFGGCKLVGASAADVKLLRLFGFDPAGLDEIGERIELEQKRAA